MDSAVLTGKQESDMQVTNKQIEWAQQIKSEMMPMINMRADQFRKAAAAAKDGAKALEIVEKAVAIIEQRPASYWIDNRPEQNGALNTKAAHQVFAQAAQEAAAQ